MRTELKDVIHLYIGCECIVFEDGKIIAKMPLTQTMIYNINLPIAVNNNLSIKPILRASFALTDEEFEQWDNISTPVGEMAVESAQKIHLAKRLSFYRSIGIDCDDLISTGQAIDKAIRLK